MVSIQILVSLGTLFLFLYTVGFAADCGTDFEIALKALSMFCVCLIVLYMIWSGEVLFIPFEKNFQKNQPKWFVACAPFLPMLPVVQILFTSILILGVCYGHFLQF